MRTFFSAHWKSLVALILLILLAVVTMSPESADASVAARLRQHIDAIASAQHDNRKPAGREGTARYIEATLTESGYQVRRQEYRAEGIAVRSIEVSLANVAAGRQPARIFIVGAHYDSAQDAAGANGSGTAAVLELARQLKHLRPSPGTELRFVFFANGDRPANFIAFVGTRESSAEVAQALAAFHAGSNFPEDGLVVPAYVQGITLSNPRRYAAPALMVTDTAFLHYPYYHTTDDDAPHKPDCRGLARVVNGLSHTIAALTGMARS